MHSHLPGFTLWLWRLGRRRRHPHLRANGAALASVREVQRLADGDRSDHPDAPRGVLRRQAVRPLPDEETLVDAALATVVDDDHYPGDAGGVRGLLNATGRAWYRGYEAADVRKKPPLLWVRGDQDPEHLGGPGQPVHDQIRTFFAKYREAGGAAAEQVVPGVGHHPHLEDPGQFWELWSRAFYFRDNERGSTPSFPSRR